MGAESGLLNKQPWASAIGRNALLGLLAEEELIPLLPHFEKITLALDQSLSEPGTQMSHVYFPVDSIVSVLCVMEDGASAEIAVVGYEGVVGVSLFMGGEITPSRAIVQSAGQAYRLKGQLLKNEFYRAGTIQRLLLRYTQALLTQMAQTAVCNRHHSLDSYNRGHIAVIGRPGLETRVCECYAVVKNEAQPS